MKKVINMSEKDIFLPWGQWNYAIKAGGELVNPPTVVIHAMQERYKVRVEEVEEAVVETKVEKPVEIKEVTVERDVPAPKRMGRPPKRG